MIYLDFLEPSVNTLAHEFQHFIHFNHDQDELRWFDEGCAELATYLTSTLPESSNNLTFFADNYFRFSYDDSLVFWNYLSSNGKDVRIDYGGAYLFLFFLYEQLGSSVLSSLVNDTSNCITSLVSILFSSNLTFNEYFFQWQMTLFLDQDKYSFTNLDFVLHPLSTIDSETIAYSSAPYYGFYCVGSEAGSRNLEITLTNNDQKKVFITLLHFYKDAYYEYEFIETSNYSLSFSSLEEETSLFIIVSLVDDSFPHNSGNIGLGEFASFSIRTINPFHLLLTTPLYVQNATHFSIFNLHILFLNQTDIFFGYGEKVVFLTIDSYFETLTVPLTFKPEIYFGWGGTFSLSSFLPGTYTLYLNDSIGKYSLFSSLTSFIIVLDVIIDKPLVFYDNQSVSLSVSVNISIFPSSCLKDILLLSTISIHIYSSDKKLFLSASLYSNDQKTWKITIDCSSFPQNYYFAKVFFTYLNFSLESFPSELVYIESELLSSTTFSFFDFVLFFIFSTFCFFLRKNFKTKHFSMCDTYE
ncbi:MAG: hypothetical protein ACTSUR_03775 [Candidatus Heimdallarchaeaceae archaeon]